MADQPAEKRKSASETSDSSGKPSGARKSRGDSPRRSARSEKRPSSRRQRDSSAAPGFEPAKVEAAVTPWLDNLLELAGLRQIRLELDPELAALRLVVEPVEAKTRGARPRKGSRASDRRSRSLSMVQLTEKVAAVETLLASMLERENLGSRSIWVSLETSEPELESSDLQKAVESLAQIVINSGSPCALGPMRSSERRRVHEAAAKIPGVWTRSAGDGPMRRLWLLPDRSTRR